MSYFKFANVEQSKFLASEIEAHLEEALRTRILGVYTLEDYEKALTIAVEKSSYGKIVFKPN